MPFNYNWKVVNFVLSFVEKFAASINKFLLLVKKYLLLLALLSAAKNVPRGTVGTLGRPSALITYIALNRD